MKKILISVLLIAAMVLSLVSCGAGMTMGTGGTSGTYYAYGGILGNQIKASAGITVNVVSTDGSKANILGIDAGNYQLGTVQSDVMAYAWNGTNTFAEDGAVKSFRVIGGLYAEAVQLVTMDSSIKSVKDLKGKSVSIGAAGSGVYFNAIDILAAAGLKETDIKAQYQSFADSADALKDGKIDAAFIVAGEPTAAVTELCATTDAYLVELDDAHIAKLMETSALYAKYTIPAGTYKGIDKDTLTVGVKATIVVNADVDDEVVYDIVSTIFENKDAITAAYAKGAALDLEFASVCGVPYHTGAAKYFAEKGIDVLVVDR